MINDLPTHSVIPSKKSNSVQDTQYSAFTCSFLRKVEAVLARLHKIS